MGHAKHSGEIGSGNYPVSGTWTTINIYPYLNVNLNCTTGRQRKCQEDPVSLPSGGLEKTTRRSPHHMAEHRPTGPETPPPYAPRSSRFSSEPPSV